MLEELAERIEKLDGPDREVDAEIWWEHGSGKAEWPDYAECDTLSACGFIFGRVPGRPANWERVGYRGPAFTASLDAAMTLYEVVPAMVPSCPRKAAAEALRGRSE